MLKVLRALPRRVWLILTKPERFFKKIVLDGSLEESMIRAALFGMLGGLAMLAIGLAGGGTLTFGTAFVKLVGYPIVAVAVLFVFSGLLMMFSEITGGNREWEVAVKGTASIFFLYPVILIMDALAFNCASLWIINIIVDGYVLFLLYNIALHCMNGKKWAVLAIIGLAAVMLLMIYGSDYRIGWLALKNPAAAVSCLA
jgi:hypothetical protein